MPLPSGTPTPTMRLAIIVSAELWIGTLKKFDEKPMSASPPVVPAYIPPAVIPSVWRPSAGSRPRTAATHGEKIESARRRGNRESGNDQDGGSDHGEAFPARSTINSQARFTCSSSVRRWAMATRSARRPPTAVCDRNTSPA